MSITHYPTCSPNYPEKLKGEAPQLITEDDLGDGYWVRTCVDCGAVETNLPPEDDPYWDEER